MSLEKRLRRSFESAQGRFAGESVPAFSPPKTFSKPTVAVATVLVAAAGVIAILFPSLLGQPEGPAGGDTTTTTVTTPPVTSDPSPHPEFTPPTVPAFDPGVATSAMVIHLREMDDFESAQQGLTPADFEGPDTIGLELESCEVVAPGQWMLDGSIGLTGESTVLFNLRFVLRPAGMSDGYFWNDAPETRPIRVTFSESGRFRIHANLLDPESEWFSAIDSAFPPEALCEVSVLAASVPTGRSAQSAPVGHASEFPTWTAPADSIQALGIGAQHREFSDPRNSWARMVWHHRYPAAEVVWIPIAPLLDLNSFGSTGACENVQLSGGGVWVEMSRYCSLEWVDRRGTPPEGSLPDVDGFERVMWHSTPALLTERDGWTIAIGSEPTAPPDRDSIADVAGSLTRFRNLFPATTDVPGADSALDNAILTKMQAEGAVERGRRQLAENRYAVVALGRMDSDRGKTVPAILHYTAELRGDLWVVEGGGGGSGGCLFGGGTGGPSAYVTYDPSWVIQQNTPEWARQPGTPAGWVTLETVNGVVWFDDDLPHAHFRALDAEGKVVACTWIGPLEPGEEWSPWTPSHDTWDLPVTVTPSTGLTEDSSVTVSGQGFPPESSLEVQVCRVEDADRPDIAICQLLDSPTMGYVRSGADGSFSLTFTVTAAFIADWDIPVDCRTDRCVVRVIHPIGGAIRSGQAPITFSNP